MLNELKIDYLRNGIYQFQIWLLFGTWTAAYLVSKECGVRAGFYLPEAASAPADRAAPGGLTTPGTGAIAVRR